MVYESLAGATWNNAAKVKTPSSALALILDWNGSGGATLDGHGDIKAVWWPAKEAKSVSEGKARTGGGYVDRDTGRYVLLSIDCDEDDFSL